MTAPDEPAKLLAAFDPIERSLIELMAVSYQPESATYLATALGKLGLRLDGRAIKNDAVRALADRLKARGILSQGTDLSVPERLAHETMLQLAREGRLEKVAEIVRALRPAQKEPGALTATWPLAVRELRIAVYSKQWDAARALSKELPSSGFWDVCNPFDRALVAQMPADRRSRALAGIVATGLNAAESVEEAFAMFEAEPELTDHEHRALVEGLMFRGRFDDAERRLANHKSIESKVGRAFLLLLRGRIPEAIAAYDAARTAFLKWAGKRNVVFPDRAGLFFVVALLAEGSSASLARAAGLLADVKSSHALHTSYEILREVLLVLDRRKQPDYEHFSPRAPSDVVEILVRSAAALWTGARLSPAAHEELEKLHARSKATGLHWVAAQAADLLSALSGKNEVAAPLLPAGGGMRLAAIVQRGDRWTDTLQKLAEVVAETTPAESATASPKGEPDRRLVWVVSSEYTHVGIEPREQSRTKGVWSKGRPVALKRLYESADQLDYLTAQDHAVRSLITLSIAFSRGYKNEYFNLDAASALRVLAGSPNVLIEMPGGQLEPCEVREASPRLEVTRANGQLSLSLSPRPLNEQQSVAAEKRGPRVVEIVSFAPVHHAIAKVLGEKPLDMPASGEGELRAVLQKLSGHVAVQADLSGQAEGAESVPGDPRPWFVFRTLGDGFLAAGRVRPLGVQGPLAQPGQGGTTLLAQVAGRQTSATRDLGEEARRFESVLAACPGLSACRSADGDFLFPDAERALGALAEIRALGDQAVVEWPAGEALQSYEPAGADNVQWTIKSQAGGFSMRGVLSIPNHKNIDITDLSEYLLASPGRFFKLSGDERYLAITAELRARLDELLGLMDRAGRDLRIHPLAVPLVADLLGPSPVKADEGWRTQLARFTASEADVEIPSTLRGELRPYQVDGFRWLVRLSRWGAGGCLADDMGLGKTIQTIALLLSRATVGPALVVAPTSVIPTWVDEVQRFAPTLHVRTFTGAARAADLDGLGPFDVLVTSYTLLQMDIDALSTIEFATAILDEAQFIKNADTKRARAAIRLRAGFRVVTTGTPIENRIDDLHSLFSFLNPGLLGSAESFQAKFGRPMDRGRDGQARAAGASNIDAKDARTLLKKLITPFVLRRTKTQVLPELPARTEVTLRVPLDPAETAAYELIRETALSSLAGEVTTGKEKGKARIQILAAIMRLRRAASNTRMVLPDAQGPSSKLAALGDLLDDLLPNRHKVLVFSQFVDHLALVKEMLDERGVSYQYLDGSTSMAARKLAIDSFQAGGSDLFLISLKAGGFGLNLTAADYVVHMDPWWNPAVEDQASDRAHRIGQSRPVTIYRLVARDTIEDRILLLHHRKRELASGILEGSDLAGQMSEAELLDLIRGATL
ncbi:MAG: DEAD/DEAH box helicase [Polyangiaceae bacterium]|nr:DEAD/DEAH box helicase [Polyangiaceae bacterium]